MLCYEPETFIGIWRKNRKWYALGYNIPCCIGFRKIPENLLQQSNFFHQHPFLQISDHCWRQLILISRGTAMLNIANARVQELVYLRENHLSVIYWCDNGKARSCRAQRGWEPMNAFILLAITSRARGAFSARCFWSGNQGSRYVSPKAIFLCLTLRSPLVLK